VPSPSRERVFKTRVIRPLLMIEPKLPAKRKHTKIAFFGNFGQKNLGNEATLQAILCRLRKSLPDAEMICICTGPAETRVAYNIAAVPIHALFVNSELFRSNQFGRFVRKIFVGIPSEFYRWILAIATLAGTEALIVPGTQFLSDNLTGPWGWPYMTFRWSLAAKLRGCKLFFVSVGVGPLRHPLSRFFIKFALRFADFRSYRDDLSKQCVGSIGLDQTNDPVYPDLVFSLPIPSVQGVEDEANKRVIAVGIKDFHGQYAPWLRKLSPDEVYRRYIEREADFVLWLLKHNYVVRIVIGDILYDTPVLTDLLNALQSRRVVYPSDNLIVEPITSVRELMSQLAKSSIIVSPRFHNIVFGLLLNRPVLAVSYHEKFSALLESPDLAKFNVRIEDADADTITDKFCQLESNLDKLKPQITENVNRYRIALDRQYIQILKLLGT